MALLTVHTVPSPVLRSKALPVARVDSRVARLMEDMLETMYAEQGIGLAAIQVGVAERVIAVDLTGKAGSGQALLMANPVILKASEETWVCREGCLSVPDQYAEVTRPRRIRVGYLDREGRAQELEAEDLLSQCIQHEIDHLDGVLFVDHLSSLRRGMLLKKAEKVGRARHEEKLL